MKCNNCNSDVPFDRTHCPTCGEFVGFPNVREISSVKESEALERRYQKNVKKSQTDGRDCQLSDFENEIRNSFAVVAVNLDDLFGFLSRRDALYSTYSLLVSGEVRKAASAADDKTRRKIEGAFWGSYAEEIRYAAHSIDGKGLSSYGSFTLKLKDIAVKTRATILEDNSYIFFHKFSEKIPGDFPAGYRALWRDRHKLAVAKHGDQITADTTKDDYPGILLACSSNRMTDVFIEVHIYGSFDSAAIEGIVGKSNVTKKAEKAQLAVIKEKIARNSIQWIEA